ncbi:hypothetical protein F0365_02395 [Nonlabens sp. Ci31]|uniref:hypothetical protein n=1 Tax=Nonlabens sp. Ci31 TaxID=2608253 RepID=UPI0014631573|nr:hypothetical protein [Nonlabens sp. Ci31]QJP33339.1 hypothetical protein F0365_02395 [Nonlabens sp. Ci31]
MIKFFTLPLLMIFSFLTFGNLTELNTQNESEYEKNLNTAAELYLKEYKIPDSILIKLVPKNHIEFELYYRTTGPEHNLGKTDFFYETTGLIFEQVISKKKL